MRIIFSPDENECMAIQPDLEGRERVSISTENTLEKIKLPELKNGPYILKLTIGNNVFFKKLMILQ